MLAASHEIFPPQALAFLANHEDCPVCRETQWTPAEKGRPCLHRHDELTSRVTRPLCNLILEYCSRFTTNNDGLVRLFIRGLEAEGILMAGPSQPSSTQEKSEAVAKDPEPTPRQIQEAPDLWQGIVPALLEIVKEENFNNWLTPVHLLSVHDKLIVLGCHNQFFKEYLTDHYTEVIEEVLRQRGELRPVIFRVVEQAQEAPEPEEAPAIPEPPRPPTKHELRIQRRLQAREEATSKKSGLNHKLLASLLAVIEAEETEEDRNEAEQQRSSLKEAHRDQRAKPSYFWPDDKATPKKLRKTAEQFDRDSS